MRILFISTTFPDASSPARGTYNSALCAALARNHEIHAIAPRSFLEAVPFRLKGRKYELPTELKSIGISANYPIFWHTPKMMQEKSGGQMWWSVRKDVESAIKNFKPDAVLSYWAHPEGEVGLLAGQLAGVPSAVIVGGSDVLVLPNLPRRGERVRDVLLQSDTVITVSNGLKNSVIDLGVNAASVQTIYQGIDPAVFHQQETRVQAQQKLKLNSGVKHFVWVGRIVPVKALDVLIDAADNLRNQNLSFELHLIGDGPERSRLEQRVAELDLSRHVLFEGTIGHDEIADWYRAADLTVMSSDSEGLPNVLRESLACGTPFVSTDVGSISEIAHPSYSRLTPRQDAKRLAAAINETLADNFASEAALYQARIWEDTARETVNLFEHLRTQREQETGSEVKVASNTAPQINEPAGTR